MSRFFYFKDMNQTKSSRICCSMRPSLALIIFSSLPLKLPTAARILLCGIFSHSFSSERFNASTFEWEDAQAFFQNGPVTEIYGVKIREGWWPKLLFYNCYGIDPA